MKDIDIANAAQPKKIIEIAQNLGLNSDQIEPYGNYKAKLDLQTIPHQEDGKLILVTSINPTPAGEGKSTVTIGLADALSRLGKKTVVALREPSLGPVLGMKGGATGGGYAQVVPMTDINLHFTGDIHALTSAHNTLSALIDNHIYQGNELNIDPRRLIWKRVVDINDRELRHITVGLGSPVNGVPREDGFDITVASELMAILCLAKDLTDLKQRISKIVIGYTYQKEPVEVGQLGVQGAITTLLKDALKPNLVQTLEGTPALIHGGPFANIAHGCNSVLATQTALSLGDYVITEAGFGADLGAEKFLDIKTPQLSKTPDSIVVVATVRAIKMHGGVALADLAIENLAAIEIGFMNLAKHLDNMKRYGVPVIVAVNEFTTDTVAEVDLIEELCENYGVEASTCSVWADGGEGGLELADNLLRHLDQPKHFTPLYQNAETIEAKIEKVVTTIYGGNAVEYSAKARQQLKAFAENGWDQLPICIAKTQYSLSDNAKLLGRPTEFTIHVQELIPKIGAGFIVALTGNVMTMPGLPKKPAALQIDIDEKGTISGLF